MKTIKIKAVIHDLDSTIYGTLDGALAHWQKLLFRAGIPFGRSERSLMIKSWGKSGTEIFQDALGISAEEAERVALLGGPGDMDASRPLIRGAREALAFNCRHDIANLLLTSRPRNEAIHILESHGILKYFRFVYANDDAPYIKPDPRVFEKPLACLRRFGITRRQCVYVGDTFFDFAAGQGAGVRTVMVLTGPYKYAVHRAHFDGFMVNDADVISSVKYMPLWFERNNVRFPKIDKKFAPLLL